MNDGNPPSSYYDPPDDCPYEINDERVPSKNAICERCKEPSYRNVEVRDTRVRYGIGTWQEVCEQHYGTVLEDYVRDIRDYEPEYQKEE